MTAPDLIAGYADPVRESAAAFRAILDAMARPGTIQPLPVSAPAPGSMNAGAVAVALTLLDGDAPVWLAPDLNEDAVRTHLRFHTGVSIADGPEQCAFAFVRPADLPGLFDRLPVGTPEYPDRSATAVVLVDGFDGDAGRVLSGPGIDGEAWLAPQGIDAAGWSVLARNHLLYPLGVDTIFAGPDALAALPRSTRLSEREA